MQDAVSRASISTLASTLGERLLHCGSQQPSSPSKCTRVTPLRSLLDMVLVLRSRVIMLRRDCVEEDHARQFSRNGRSIRNGQWQQTIICSNARVETESKQCGSNIVEPAPLSARSALIAHGSLTRDDGGSSSCSRLQYALVARAWTMDHVWQLGRLVGLWNCGTCLAAIIWNGSGSLTN